MTVISAAVPVAVRIFIPSYIGRSYLILPTLSVVSIVPINFSGVSSPFASSYTLAVFEEAPLVLITIAIKTNLPVMLVRPLVVMFFDLLAEASCGFIIYGNEIDALGLALPDGDCDPDGLKDLLADFDAEAEGLRLPDGLNDLEADFEAEADGLLEADPDFEPLPDGLADFDTEELGLSEAEALALSEALGDRDPDGLSLPEGLADLEALALPDPDGLRDVEALLLSLAELDADSDALGL